MTTSLQFKTRFCPSPTGLMHLGNLRTALFNVLLAQSEQAQGKRGHFLLRIEDTDLARSKDEYVEKLKRDLEWLGLHWQEGPDVGGEHSPYYQSERVSIYEEYYRQLLNENKAYYCFCSEQTLSITRKAQLASGQPPRYPGTCRNLTPEQIEKKKASGIVPTLRFKIPDDTEVRFEDLIQGPKVFAANDIGDFIIQKQDKSATFMFCNAVDDALMGVTHALRGEDHLTNTPRQILILEALNLSIPHYGHMPLIVGQDGKPLSKRNGSMSIEELRGEGYWPLAILNYLSRLGHHYVNDRFLSLLELGNEFSIARIGRSPARFDMHQLHHWQKEAVLHCERHTLWHWMKHEVESIIPVEKHDAFVETIRENIVFPSDAKNWAVALFRAFDLSTVRDILKEAGSRYFEVAKHAAEEKGIDAAHMIQRIKEDTGKKGKSLFLPLRIALTGRADGPELAKICELLGEEKIVERLQQVIHYVKNL